MERRLVMTEKYRAIDIANYILWYANEEHPNESITALKLHKLLYYVVAAYTKKYDSLPFSEKIEKWQYGPVTPSVYHAFKSYGYATIPGPVAKYRLTDKGFKKDDFDSSIIERSHAKLFNETIDQLIHKSARDLVEATHQELAWKSNEKAILGGVRDLTYELEELKSASMP